MKTGRPEGGVCLSSEEKQQLQSIVSSRSPRHGLLTRIRIMRLAVEGVSNREMGKIGLSAQSGCKWRWRFLDQGPFSLRDELRPGRGHNLPTQEDADATESFQ